MAYESADSPWGKTALLIGAILAGGFLAGQALDSGGAEGSVPVPDPRPK